MTALRRVQVDHRVALWLMLLVAFALRVYRLGAQPIWWDESLSLYRATRDLPTILANTIVIQNVVTIDLQPPLYFILLHLLVPAFGITEFALRFLSLAANLLTIPLLYALGRRWLSRQVGLLAALFGTLSPFYVWFSQEARPYALVLFWSLLALYALTRAFAHSSLEQARGWILLYILASIAALYTNYYAIFLFPFHVLVIALQVWPNARKFILLPALPLASAIFLIPKVMAAAAGNANSGPTFVPLGIILRDLVNSFSFGITIDPGQVVWADVAWGAIFLIGVAASASIQSPLRVAPRGPTGSAGGSATPRVAIFLLAYLLIPTLGLYLASYVRPLYQNSRYLIAWSPAFYFGIAAGVMALVRRWKFLTVPTLAFFLIGPAVSLNNLYFDPRFGKDDHRAWAEFLRERARPAQVAGSSDPGDFLILDSPHTAELYHYYAGDLLSWTTLPILGDAGATFPQEDLAAVREAYHRYARVWFLSMHAPFDDPQGRIEKILNQEGVLLDRANFRGTSTEIALSLYAQSLPMANVSEIAHPLDLLFDSRLRLVGFEPPKAIAPGARGILKLFWQLDEPAGEDYGVSLRLTGEMGVRIGQWDGVPLGNRAGSSTWPTKKIIVDAHDLPIEAGTHPGEYCLQIQVYHSATSNGIGDAVELCDMIVVR